MMLVSISAGWVATFVTGAAQITVSAATSADFQITDNFARLQWYLAQVKTNIY